MMKTSEEYREKASHAGKQLGGGEAVGMLLDAADLIDAVNDLLKGTGIAHFSGVYDAEKLLEKHRASLRTAKPASGCEGCKHAEAANVSTTAWKRTCEECSRRQLYDRWEAKP